MAAKKVKSAKPSEVGIPINLEGTSKGEQVERGEDLKALSAEEQQAEYVSDIEKRGANFKPKTLIVEVLGEEFETRPVNKDFIFVISTLTSNIDVEDPSSLKAFSRSVFGPEEEDRFNVMIMEEKFRRLDEKNLWDEKKNDPDFNEPEPDDMTTWFLNLYNQLTQFIFDEMQKFAPKE